jgi:hypothetical protein
MKQTFTLIILCFFSFVVSAQDNKRICETEEVFQRQLRENPGMLEKIQAIESFTNEAIKYKQRFPSNARTGNVTIPVVVHVVWNTNEQNITDAQIQSQIRILNEDFQKRNADASLTPAIYASRVANAQIEFVLASKDPDGNTTNGITRTKSRVKAFSSNDAIKSSKRGGKDPWNTTRYLNIWVGNLSGGLLGYAQFPGGPVSTDGVVVLYSAFGDTGTLIANYNKGRTATHEVGHYLNLRHIWGDASCGNDFVEDTPTQQTSNGGCPAFPKITCGNQGDMSMNYMDYTYDRCMYMFTTGQSARMDATFATGGPRYSLVSSTGSQVATLSDAPLTSGRSADGLSEFTLYPNPVNTELTVEYTLSKESPVTIEFYNAMGALIKTISLGTQTTGFHFESLQLKEIPALTSGIYICSIKGADKVQRLRFVVSR